MRYTHLLCAQATLCLANAILEGSHAQTIRGVVVHESTSEAIAGAAVALVDVDGHPVDSVVTGPDGRFALGCESGHYYFHVRQMGLTPVLTDEFEFPKDSANLEVTLLLSAEPAAILLPGITVAADAIPRGKMRGFYQRQLQGFGSFVTRETIESYHPRVFSDVLRRIPGVTVKPAKFGRGNVVTMMRSSGLGGQCEPVVYMDGIRMPPRQWPDTYLNPDDVEGLEVYKGPSTTPEQFRSINSPCGVIVVWTR